MFFKFLDICYIRPRENKNIRLVLATLSSERRDQSFVSFCREANIGFTFAFSRSSIQLRARAFFCLFFDLEQLILLLLQPRPPQQHETVGPGRLDNAAAAAAAAATSKKYNNNYFFFFSGRWLDLCYSTSKQLVGSYFSQEEKEDIYTQYIHKKELLQDGRRRRMIITALTTPDHRFFPRKKKNSA